MSLGQFYTPALAGGWLVREVAAAAPSRVCDLGVGEGELLAAAQHRWRQAQLLAADIDPQNVSYAQRRLGRAECRQADVLRYDLPHLLGIDEESVDVALGNPPYGALDVTTKHLAILRDAGLINAISARRVTRDISNDAIHRGCISSQSTERAALAVGPQVVGTQPRPRRTVSRTSA